MDDYADIYYVDDNRNAVVTTDHRTGSSSSVSSGRSPWPFGPRPPVQVQPARTVYIASPSRPAPVQAPVMYGPPPWYPQNQSAAAQLFGKLTTGMVVEMVAQ